MEKSVAKRSGSCYHVAAVCDLLGIKRGVLLVNEMTRMVMEYILTSYGVEAEYPWKRSPENAVFRNPANRKWFALLLGKLPLRCLGLKENGTADVLNLKCDPLLAQVLADRMTIFPAYHMNKEHWISIRLDSALEINQLSFLIDASFRLAAPKGKKKNSAPDC